MEFSFIEFVGLFFYLAIIASTIRLMGFLIELERSVESLTLQISRLESKIENLSKEVRSQTYDIQEQINETKSEILDTQDRLIKKNKKSLKIIKNEIEEVKKVSTLDLENYSELADINTSFGEIMNQSMQFLGKVLKGDDDPATIIDEVNKNNHIINLNKVVDVLSADMEVMTKAYTMIYNINLELSSDSDNFFIEFNKRLKFKPTEISEDSDCSDHADYCPFCLSYDILTEMNLYEGIIEKVISYIKDYYELLKTKNLDYWHLTEEDSNLKLIFCYHQNMWQVVGECSIFAQIKEVKNTNNNVKILDLINKIMTTTDDKNKFLEDLNCRLEDTKEN